MKVYSSEGKPLLQEDTNAIIFGYSVENPGEHTYKELEEKDVLGYYAAWNDNEDTEGQEENIDEQDENIVEGEATN